MEAYFSAFNGSVILIVVSEQQQRWSVIWSQCFLSGRLRKYKQNKFHGANARHLFMSQCLKLGWYIDIIHSVWFIRDKVTFQLVLSLKFLPILTSLVSCMSLNFRRILENYCIYTKIQYQNVEFRKRRSRKVKRMYKFAHLRPLRDIFLKESLLCPLISLSWLVMSLNFSPILTSSNCCPL